MAWELGAAKAKDLLLRLTGLFFHPRGGRGRFSGSISGPGCAGAASRRAVFLWCMLNSNDACLSRGCCCVSWCDVAQGEVRYCTGSCPRQELLRSQFWCCEVLQRRAVAGRMGAMWADLFCFAITAFPDTGKQDAERVMHG